MESHRMSGSPDSRFQRGYMQQRSPRTSPDNVFGVRVQVQGIKGHPYVVLNNGGQESHRDVSVIAHQSEYSLALVRGSPLGSPSMDKRPANRLSQYGDSPSELRESPRTAASTAFHYQRHPELLRPYDPENNDLNYIVPLQTPSVARPGQLHTGPQPEKNQAAQVSKPRIPLPVEGPGVDENEAQIQAPGSAIPARSPNSVNTDTMSSVGKLIDRFNTTQRKGRCGPRNRLDPDERRRSRSVDSNRTSDSSSSSSSSNVASSFRASRGETPGGTCPPDSLRARFFSGEPTLASRRVERNSTSQLFRGQQGKEPTSPRAAKVLYRVEKTSLSTSTSTNNADESDERDTQVKGFTVQYSDVLKGCILLTIYSLIRSLLIF